MPFCRVSGPATQNNSQPPRQPFLFRQPLPNQSPSHPSTPGGNARGKFVRMYHDKKVVVVMPAYNAAKTLRQTHAEVLAQGLVDLIILVDDYSRDDTATIARSLE